jgi:hypothetical protein
MPVYGTCAGLILLADRIANPSTDRSFGGLDVTVQRNAFGGQVESFETELTVAGFDGPVHAAFIRAPLVVEVGPAARALATLPGGGVVAVGRGTCSRRRSTRGVRRDALPRVVPRLVRRAVAFRHDDLGGAAARVNVNGVTVKSAELGALFRDLGFAEVKTVLASGNVRFEADGPNLAARS